MQGFSLHRIFTVWRQHSHDKGSRRSRAGSAILVIHRLRKQHILRAWLAVHQGVQHKTALLRKALAFLCHAVLPVTFQAWHSYSQSKSDRRCRAECALLSMQQHRKRVFWGAWRAVHLNALHKRGQLSRALAHMRHAVLPAAFHAWTANAAWQADARQKILHCLQVDYSHLSSVINVCQFSGTPRRCNNTTGLPCWQLPEQDSLPAAQHSMKCACMRHCSVLCRDCSTGARLQHLPLGGIPCN